MTSQQNWGEKINGARKTGETYAKLENWTLLTADKIKMDQRLKHRPDTIKIFRQ